MIKKLSLLLFCIVISIGATSQELLFDNGPFVNQTGNPDLSIVQTSTLGHTTTGYQVSDNIGAGLFTLADDVTITGEEWTVESVSTFAFVPGELNTATPMDDFSLQVWDGDPSDPSSTIIWGDHTTDILISQTWTGAFRVEEDAQTEFFNPIMQLNLETPNLVLQPGTYWFHFKNEDVTIETAQIILGPLVPPITINGQGETGNALIFRANNNTWNNLIDFGSGERQGIPFQIRGSSSSLNVEDNNLSSNFEIVPNPVNDLISINKLESFEIEDIKIYNIIGQKVYEINSTELSEFKDIDVSGYDAGVYLMNIISNGQVLTKKFIKE